MRKEFRWIVALAAILFLALFIASNLHHSVLKNDPTAFAERAHKVLDGEIPYVDFEFEHLPLALVPIVGVGLLEQALGDVNYTLLYWLVMGGVLFGVGGALNALGRRLGVEDAALRWLAISWGVLPLIAFRLDAVSVLLVLIAIVLAINGRERRSAWAMGLGIASKGWPIVLVGVDWWRGKRRRAIVTVASTVVGVALLAMFPLFRSGREFFGVHIETMTGAATALARSLAGASTGTGIAAGASYVEVGSWAVIVNAILGITLGLSALLVLRRAFTWRRAMDLIGVSAMAIMLLSPLLSAQFVVWITPFAALSASRRVQVGTAVAAFLTGVFVTFWYMEAAWWWAIIVARNAALLYTGWTWSRFAARPGPVPGRTAEAERVTTA